MSSNNIEKPATTKNESSTLVNTKTSSEITQETSNSKANSTASDEIAEYSYN